MPQIQDVLLAYAEVAIAIAGFSAIVVVLKRSVGGLWSAADADQFHGMVIHSVFAVLFCLLPVIVNVVVQDVVTTIHFTCLALGVQIVMHTLGVITFSKAALVGKLVMGFGFLVGALQFLVYTDWAAHREFEIYQVGLAWHILQSGMLFVMLVWIPKAEIDAES